LSAIGNDADVRRNYLFRLKDRQFNCCRDDNFPPIVGFHHRHSLRQIATEQYCGIKRPLTAIIFKDWAAMRQRYRNDLRDLCRVVELKEVLPPGDTPLALNQANAYRHIASRIVIAWVRTQAAGGFGDRPMSQSSTCGDAIDLSNVRGRGGSGHPYPDIVLCLLNNAADDASPRPVATAATPTGSTTAGGG
jgi:hypothetical protein